MVLARLVVPLALTAFAGCGLPHVAGGRGSFDRQLITQDEIVASRALTAFDVIHKLRGNFLSSRGETSFTGSSSRFPTVYVDEQNWGNIEILRTIPAAVVASIRLYRSWEATTRYGVGNMGGVIAITTRQGGAVEDVSAKRP